MSGLRKAVYLAMSFAALAAAIAIMSTTARAQSGPSGALRAPAPGSGPAPSIRTRVAFAGPASGEPRGFDPAALAGTGLSSPLDAARPPSAPGEADAPPRDGPLKGLTPLSPTR